MRLPTEVLEQHLRPILEGLLLWSDDSKNKFKLKVLHRDVLPPSHVANTAELISCSCTLYNIRMAWCP